MLVVIKPGPDGIDRLRFFYEGFELFDNPVCVYAVEIHFSLFREHPKQPIQAVNVVPIAELSESCVVGESASVLGTGP